MDRMFDGSRQYFEKPFEPLYRADLLQSLDKLSLRDRLTQLALTPEEELLINGQTAIYSGGASTDGGFTMFAHWWALAGHTNDGWGETQKYRIAKGTGALLNAMIADAKPKIMLNYPGRVGRRHRQQGACHAQVRRDVQRTQGRHRGARQRVADDHSPRPCPRRSPPRAPRASR
ncbi:hypothetical protein SMICM304S_10907 [Streptomyces microflavus]